MRKASIGGLMVLVFCFSAMAPAGENLVVNGTFEEGKTIEPWSLAGDEGIKQTVTLVDSGRGDGSIAAKLECTSFVKTGGSSHAMLAQVGTLNLKKGQWYRLTARVYADRRVSLTVQIRDTSDWSWRGIAISKRVSKKWIRIDEEFQIGRDLHESSRLAFYFTEVGTVWIDEVSLTRIEPVTPSFGLQVPDIGAKNLVPNSSFECGGILGTTIGNWSTFAGISRWGNVNELVGEVVRRRRGLPHGNHCLEISLDPQKLPTVDVDYFTAAHMTVLAPLTANIGWIPVEKGKEYTLSCWMRSDRDGLPAVLMVRHRTPGKWKHDRKKEVTLSSEWRRYEFTAKASHSHAFVAVGPDITEHEEFAGATVWIDAVQFERGGKATTYEPRTPVELLIGCGVPGNVFDAGGKSTFTVRACNHGNKPAEVKLKAAVTDFFDREVAGWKVTLKVPPGKRSRSTRVDFGGRKGFFRAKFDIDTGSEQYGLVERYTVIAPYRHRDSFAAMNHAFSTDLFLGVAKKGGITWHRDWSIKWQHVEPIEGTYDFSLTDPAVYHVTRNPIGLNLLCLMPPFPANAWASEAGPDVVNDPKQYRQSYVRSTYAPKDPSKLAAFIEASVRRYRDGVKYWEFLNEPIRTHYALTTERPDRKPPYYTAEDYVRLLKVMYAAVKRVDPEAVVLGGTSGPPYHPDTRDVLYAGVLPYCDIFNLHMYPRQREPETFIQDLENVQSWMKENGGVKPVWMTEFGYYADDDLMIQPRSVYTAKAWNKLLESERQCAEWTVRLVTLFLAHGIEKVFYHSGVSATVNAGQTECMLFEYGAVPRKLFVAQAAMADMLGPKPEFTGRVKWEDRYYGYVFKTPEGAAAVLWAGEEAEEREVTASVPGGFYDMCGVERHGRTCKLTTTPVYFVSTKASADAVFAGLKLK